MNINDFRYMRQGRALGIVSPAAQPFIAPITYRTPNKDHALIMLHGFASTPAVFRELLPHLSCYDGIFAPLLPGHGESIEAFSESRASDWVQFVESFAAPIFNDYKQVDVVGFSLGGLLANGLSQLYPIRRLYLLAPAFNLPTYLNKSIKGLQLLQKLGFRYMRSMAGDLHTDTHAEIAYRLLPLHAIIETILCVRDLQFKPPPCPTDVFLSYLDKVVDCQSVAARLRHYDNVKLHLLKNSAHLLPLDGDIQAIINCIKHHAYWTSKEHGFS